MVVAHSLTHSLTHVLCRHRPGQWRRWQGRRVRPGDWLCNNCGASNFASRTACFRCQTPKPPGGGGSGSYGGLSDGPTGYGGGKGGGSGGGGDVRPGDWTCPNCGANVFASKNNCFRCQTPRPGGVGGVGGPMGAGGGGERSSSVDARKVNAGMPACRDANGCLACWRLGVRFRPVCRLWRRWRALLSSRTWCTDVTSVEASTGGGVVCELGGVGAGASVEPKPGGLSKRDDDERGLVEASKVVCGGTGTGAGAGTGTGGWCEVAGGGAASSSSGLGRLQLELRRPRGARWDGIAGYFYRKGRTGGERRDADRCASDTNRVPGGVRTMDMPRPAAHAPKSRSDRPRRRGGQEPQVTGGRGALYSAYCCDGVLRLYSCNPLQLHPARPT